MIAAMLPVTQSLLDIALGRPAGQLAEGFRWTAETVLDLLEVQRHPSAYGQSGWLFFRELRVGAGFRAGAEQRVDAFALHAWPSAGHERIAYEVKIARSDFLNEIRKKPLKRRPALIASNRFFYVTLPGVAKPEEIPVECGLLEVTQTDAPPHDYRHGYRYGPFFPYAFKEIVSAPWRDTGAPSWGFVASLCRKARGILE